MSHEQPPPDGADGRPRRTGLDIARAALAAAKAEAKRRGLSAGARRPLPAADPDAPYSQAGGRRRRTVDDATRSGAHPDDRDPQTLDASLGRLVAERGWETDAAIGGAMGRWAAIVGHDIAEHSTPVSFADGELVVAASSTAWATQLRLLAPTLISRLGQDLGPETVTRLRVLGPAAPSWGRGSLRVKGRGPRDTYG